MRVERNGIKHHAAGIPVVRVRHKAPRRVGGSYYIRLILPYQPGNLSPEDRLIFKTLVRMAEKDDFPYPHVFGGLPLLHLTDFHQFSRFYLRVVGAFIAIGAYHKDNALAFPRPARHRPSDTPLGIIRVRSKNQSISLFGHISITSLI